MAADTKRPISRKAAAAAIRSTALLADSWDCACGYQKVSSWMEFCSRCWAERKTGDRQWAKLPVMDFRPGGEVPRSANPKLSDGPAPKP